jgi:hypothetical protein
MVGKIVSSFLYPAFPVSLRPNGLRALQAIDYSLYSEILVGCIRYHLYVETN